MSQQDDASSSAAPVAEKREVEEQAQAPVVDEGAAGVAAAAARAEEAKKRSAYHYWHDKVDELKEKGDVAPMPVHVALETKPVEVDHVVVKAITQYSFCDGDKNVDVYIDWPELKPETVSVTFANGFLTAEIRTSSTLVNRLHVKMSKDVVEEECKFKCKPAQLAIKLRKANASDKWWDLEYKEGISL